MTIFCITFRYLYELGYVSNSSCNFFVHHHILCNIKIYYVVFFVRNKSSYWNNLTIMYLKKKLNKVLYLRLMEFPSCNVFTSVKLPRFWSDDLPTGEWIVSDWNSSGQHIDAYSPKSSKFESWSRYF